MNSECVDCGGHFTRSIDDSWKKRCFPCWLEFKRQRRVETVGIDRELQAAEIKRLNQLNRDLLGELKEAFREIQAEKRKVALLRYKSNMTLQPNCEPKFNRERLRQMILLCHPDRHGNSQAANDATQWLLSLRREAQ